MENLNKTAEEKMWKKFYTTFNDDNIHHAENAFINNGLSDASAERLFSENQNWYKEILSHGMTQEEILKIMPEAERYC